MRFLDDCRKSILNKSVTIKRACAVDLTQGNFNHSRRGRKQRDGRSPACGSGRRTISKFAILKHSRTISGVEIIVSKSKVRQASAMLYCEFRLPSRSIDYWRVGVVPVLMIGCL